MQRFSTLKIPPYSRAWASIGAFDGLHFGHQHMIERLVKGAHQADAAAIVITFYPHPEMVLRGLMGRYYLTSPSQRESILERMGVDAVVTLKFTERLASQSAEEFMRALAASMPLQRLIIGHDFALGRDRGGDQKKLLYLGDMLGYRLEIIPPVTIDGEVVSSSRIRHMLQSGNLVKANHFLNRPYCLAGSISADDPCKPKFTAWSKQVLPMTGKYLATLHGDGSIPVTASITSGGVRVENLASLDLQNPGKTAAELELHDIIFTRL